MNLNNAKISLYASSLGEIKFSGHLIDLTVNANEITEIGRYGVEIEQQQLHPTTLKMCTTVYLDPIRWQQFPTQDDFYLFLTQGKLKLYASLRLEGYHVDMRPNDDLGIKIEFFGSCDSVNNMDKIILMSKLKKKKGKKVHVF